MSQFDEKEKKRKEKCNVYNFLFKNKNNYKIRIESLKIVSLSSFIFDVMCINSQMN